MLRQIGLVLGLILTFSLLVSGQNGVGDAKTGLPKSIAAPLLTSPILIDGKLDDPAWKKAPWSATFDDIEGNKNPKPPLGTKIKMLHDSKGLYIGVEMEEPHLQGTFSEHDSYIFHLDNDFEVFIDSDGDCQNYVELEMNAKNTTWDLLMTKPYRDGGRALDSFELKGVQTAVFLDGTLNDPSDTDRGWTVEIFLPWKSLAEVGSGVPPKIGDRWRINFSRVEWEWDIKDNKYVKKPGRPERNWVWSPQGEINMHLPERWGSVVFVGPEDGLKPLPLDEEAKARLCLGRIHQAQQAYRGKKGSFAQTLAELKLDPTPFAPEDITLWANADRYQAQVPSKRPLKLSIREDGGLR
ncbi:MAG: sugar-binding protein [Gemmataceae bacterium]